jgi:uncharacterized protein DUF1829/uncharacterized protein DUF1828
MIDEIRVLLDDYTTWLRDKSALRELGSDTVEITTPFADRNGDLLQIYAHREEDGFVLSDAGETIGDLRFSGCDLDTPRRRSLLSTTINGFGVRVDNEALAVNASPENFALRKHNLVQAMLAVNDLFHLSARSVASLFHEDVVRWLQASEVRFTPNVRFVGKTGFDQHFDFAIPASRTKPERLVNAIAYPKKENILATIWKWEDTKETRSPGSRCLAILNDSEKPIRQELMSALRNYSVTPVRWSEKDQAVPELAA